MICLNLQVVRWICGSSHALYVDKSGLVELRVDFRLRIDLLLQGGFSLQPFFVLRGDLFF